MKAYTDLKHIRTVEERIHRQIRTLHFLYEEILQAEEKIKYMAYMDKSRLALFRCRESLDENIRVLTSMETVLREASAEYIRTEKRITDRCNLDSVLYPETRFEKSRITGMEEYQSLMPF